MTTLFYKKHINPYISMRYVNKEMEHPLKSLPYFRCWLPTNILPMSCLCAITQPVRANGSMRLEKSVSFWAFRVPGAYLKNTQFDIMSYQVEIRRPLWEN